MITRLLTNANIYTLSSRQPRATTIALYHGHIVAVGDSSLRDLAGPQTKINDLNGAMLLPGFTDAHIHWEWTATTLNTIKIAHVRDKQEAISIVAEAARRAQPGTWLLGGGWSQSEWPDRAFPTASDLDPVTEHNPVYLMAHSGHAAWVNSLAMRKAGISSSTPDPVGGAIQRDASGQATGILLEGPAMALVGSLVPAKSAADLADLMAKAQAIAWQAGLTGIHDYDEPTAFEAMQVLHERGELGLRIVKNINKAYIEHAIRRLAAARRLKDLCRRRVGTANGPDDRSLRGATG